MEIDLYDYCAADEGVCNRLRPQDIPPPVIEPQAGAQLFVDIPAKLGFGRVDERQRDELLLKHALGECCDQQTAILAGWIAAHVFVARLQVHARARISTSIKAHVK